MADLENEKKLRQDIVGLINEGNRAKQLDLSLSNSLVDSIKETFDVSKNRSTADQNVLNINREINRALLNQKVNLNDVGSMQKQLAQNSETIAKSEQVIATLSQDLTKYEQDRVGITEELVAKRARIDELITEEIANAEKTGKLNEDKLKGLTKQAEITDELISQDISKLNSTQQQILFTKANNATLQRQNTIYENSISAIEEVTEVEKKSNGLSLIKNKLLGEGVTLFDLISAAVLKSSQLTNQFQQELGVSYSNARAMREQLVNSAGASNDLFINSEKLQKSFFALKDTTGVFFDLSSQSAETFTNLTERIGLAGAEAGNLTMLMRLQGKETEANLENMYDTTGAMLQTSKTTASVKDILGDVAKSSKGLQASLAGNPQALAKAAIAARELGATLADMEKTQGALLDFEQSIGAELEAELLTGKQLNLERARAAALNNDMATLGEELKKQNVDLASFGNMNVKQQEAMAKAMGMQRGELGDMLLKQEMQNKTLDEIRSTMGEQAYEQAKALSAQDKFAAATEKVKDLFVGLMSIVTPIIDVLAMMLQPIAFIAKGLSMANEATGGFTNGLIGVGLTVLALKKKFGGLGSTIKDAFSGKTTGGFMDKIKEGASGLKERIMGSTGGMDKAGAAAGKATAVPAPADNGVKIRKKLQNLARGLKAFANTKVLLGALNLIPAALGFTAMTAGAVGLAAVALMGTAAGTGLQGLGNGLIAFGNAMAAPTPLGPVGLVAPVALALLGAAMIPFAYAISLTAPAIEALGTAISAVFGGLATAVTTIIPALVQGLIDLSTNVNLGGLVGLAIGLGGLSLAIAGLATSAMLLLPALPVLAAVAGIGAVATIAAGSLSGGGGGEAAAQAGSASGEEIRAIVEETVTATINALVPEMVAALKEGQGKIKVTNDNFNNSKQSEGPSRNRNVTNNNFA
jgi:hypothetical protein